MTDDLTAIDAEVAEALVQATEEAADAHAIDQNSCGAGYDAGYRDGLLRALCIIRRLDSET